MKAKRTVLVGVVLALAVAACAHEPAIQPAMMAAKKPDPKYTNVFVEEGKYLVIDQEPIRVPRNQKFFDITWQLPADPRYTFPDDGIEIADPAHNFERCRLHPDRKRITCRFKEAKGPQSYKYTIRALDNNAPMVPLDPFIVNY